MELQYYVDIPGRDITIPDPGSMVWIDIEEGCFTDAQDVRDQGTANTAAGLASGAYCNPTSIAPVFGDSTELADYGLRLFHAAYEVPDFANFKPYNGWTKPDFWQWSSSGYMTPSGLINCDMIVDMNGRLGADFSNYSDQSLTYRQAEYVKHTLSFAIIGLQNAAIARKQKELLK